MHGSGEDAVKTAITPNPEGTIPQNKDPEMPDCKPSWRKVVGKRNNPNPEKPNPSDEDPEHLDVATVTHHSGEEAA